jgi:hypothetical protein
MSASTNLSLPYLAQGHAQKHVTVNEARLDALVQLNVASATTSAEPGSPTDGRIYILPAGKTGTNWGAMANGALAYYHDGAWEEISPREGWLAYAADTDLLCLYDGTAWTDPRAATGAAGLADANVFTATQTFAGGSGTTPSTGAAVARSSDAGAVGPFFVAYHNSASPAASDIAGGVRVYGKDSGGNDQLYAALHAVVLDPTDASEDAEWQIFTAVAGAAAARVKIGQGLVVGAPTGGDKGAGTINAAAIYDDNVLLTCGPIELMREGRLDLEKWDALAREGAAEGETRKHEAMHVLQRMLDEGFDPRDPANFCARMRQDGAAPGLYTEAEWRALLERGGKPDVGAAMTRAFLALDNLAVAFAGAMQRIEALEARLS